MMFAAVGNSGFKYNKIRDMTLITSKLTNIYTIGGRYFFISLLIVISLTTFFADSIKTDLIVMIWIAYILFFLIWFFKAKNLKIIYLTNKGLLVDGSVILNKDILSVKKTVFGGPVYTIHYKIQGEVKRLNFLPKSTMPFVTSSYVKAINKRIK
jgi:hypothetical protein